MMTEDCPLPFPTCVADRIAKNRDGMRFYENDMVILIAYCNIIAHTDRLRKRF